MAMTAKNMPYKHGFGPFAGEVYRAPMSYPFREPTEITGAQAAARAIDVIEKQVGADNLACVVIEPVLGEGGFVVPAPGFPPGARASGAASNDVVFVADEIQSGMCRTGAWFACEHEGVVPDLVTVAKGMAGGLPLAGVVGRAEMMDAPHAGGLGGTYGGNPVACAAALGAIATMERARPQRRGSPDRADDDRPAARARGEGARDRRRPWPGRDAGHRAGRARHHQPEPALAGTISAGCHQAGVLTLTCGTYGNVLRFLPPLVMPDHLLDEALDVIEEVTLGLV